MPAYSGQQITSSRHNTQVAMSPKEHTRGILSDKGMSVEEPQGLL
jgi:hypothetical protein